MDEQMNNNGYQYQPNPSPMPNQNKDGIAIAVFCAWYCFDLFMLHRLGSNQSCVRHCIIGIVFT